MRPTRHAPAVAQAAAFSLFESFRRATDVPVSPDETVRLAFERAVDPAVSGLAWTGAGDDALQCRLEGLEPALGAGLWVHARLEPQGPGLGLYMERERPALQCRFYGTHFVPDGDGWLLRERVVFPSHDGRHGEREALVRRLATLWRVPMADGWLHLGRWNDAEGAWEGPMERRLVRAALILEAARRLAPEWITGRAAP